MSEFSEKQREDFLNFLDIEKRNQYLSSSNENRKNSILLSQGFAKEKIAELLCVDKKDIVFSKTLIHALLPFQDNRTLYILLT